MVVFLLIVIQDSLKGLEPESDYVPNLFRFLQIDPSQIPGDKQPSQTRQSDDGAGSNIAEERGKASSSGSAQKEAKDFNDILDLKSVS